MFSTSPVLLTSYFTSPSAYGLEWPSIYPSTSGSPAWNYIGLHRPEPLLWRASLWKCLELSNFQRVSSEMQDAAVFSAVVQILEEAS